MTMIENFARLNARVLAAMHSAIIVCDARDPDTPIVAANQAFESLTGYTEHEVIGRNCNLLQGDDRDQKQIGEIWTAIQRQESIHSILRNYRKDGSLFYNELFIDPVRDERGAVTHFVGCQNEIPDPAAAYLKDQAWERYQRLTRREREVFQLIAEGNSNKAVAAELNISVRTAEKHRLSVVRKMEAENITHLVRFAIALSAGGPR